jgi:hypothetical protein
MKDAHTTAGIIRRALITIRENYDGALEATPAPDDCDIQGATDAGEPVNLTAIDARNEAHRDLTYWARFILDEVNEGTVTHGPRDVDVEELTRFIDIWTLAICEQHPLDGDNLHKETARHAKVLEALAKGWRTKRIEVGRCPELTMTLDGEVETITRCAGTLHAVTEEDDDGLLPPVVTCDAERDHSWTPWQWHALGRQIEATTA